MVTGRLCSRSAMRAVLLTVGILLAVAIAGRGTGPESHWPVRVDPTDVVAAAEPYRLPLVFEPNRGQADADVRFLAGGGRSTLHLLDDGIRMVLRRGDRATVDRMAQRPPKPVRGPVRLAAAPPPSIVTLRWVGAHPAPSIRGEKPIAGTVSYFLGRDPDAWITRVPQYGAVRYSELYPGIDLVTYENDGTPEYDFVVAPGAEHEQIRIDVDGASTMTVMPDGGLSIAVPGGQLVQPPPTVYQRVGGERRRLDAAFEITESGQVAFHIDEHDRRSPLVIDPKLVYSTYFGFDGGEAANEIAEDGNGGLYMAYTVFENPDPARIWLAHFDKRGALTSRALIYEDPPFLPVPVLALDTDASLRDRRTGAVYIGVTTDIENLPVVHPIQKSLEGVFDVYLMAFGLDLEDLLFATYLGGSEGDLISDMSVGPAR